MPDKLIFRVPRPVKPKDKPPVVRITLEAYTALEEISAKTGLSNCFVASQMILYAAKNTEIKTEDER
jgi:hypothetical protein|nr:MAG TPA: HicB family [Caudoviricetes sp.]DAY52367.1 MAG TPA: HicB family [Caudoviricetes sp.]